MNFWENAFLWGWADVALLRMVVKTDQMPFGEISKEDFKRITGQDFDPVVEEPEPEPEDPAETEAESEPEPEPEPK